MTKSFLEDSFAELDAASPEQGLPGDTLYGDDSNMVITETMIQQACASLDHDSELSFSSNPNAFK